jgi:hypothetical protein
MTLKLTELYIFQWKLAAVKQMVQQKWAKILLCNNVWEHNYHTSCGDTCNWLICGPKLTLITAHNIVISSLWTSTPFHSHCTNYTKINSMVLEPQGETPLISKPATRHKTGPVPSCFLKIHLLKLSSHLFPSLLSGHFPQYFSIKILYVYLVSHPSCMYSPSQSPLFHCPNIRWPAYTTKFLII